MFRTNLHILLFLDYLNAKHQSINFTHESERHGYIPFLDVNRRKTEQRFEPSLFRKDAFPGLIMKYNSALPHRYKVNLIQCLWYHDFKICSSVNLFRKEFEFLIKKFFQKGFPNKFVTDIFQRKPNFSLHSSDLLLNVPKKPAFIWITFISLRCDSDIKKELRRISEEFYPQTDLKLLLSYNFSIESMLS